MKVFDKLAAVVFGVAATMGCETHMSPTPAVLETADAETMASLTATLAAAMDRAQVELGPSDLTAESVITVLPPPLGPGEDRSLATPTYFDLMIIDGDCVAVRRETGDQYVLDGVSCRPL